MLNLRVHVQLIESTRIKQTELRLINNEKEKWLLR